MAVLETQTPSPVAPLRSSTIVRATAAVAATIFVAVAGRPGWAQTIQFFSFVTIVPLGLALVRSCYEATRFEDLAAKLAPYAAGVSAVGYFFEPGPVAAALALPWLALTVTVGIGGAIRTIDRPWPIDHHVLGAAAQGFLVVGGGWYWLSQAGLNPGGFSDAIVTLTGIHFHYAGFAMPIIVSQIGHLKPSKAINLTAVGILFGIPLTAFGLTYGGVAELVGGTFMASVGLFVAVIIFIHARSLKGGTAIAVGFSSVCLAVGMSLAAAYVINLHLGIEALSIERMVRSHGSINGFGFALTALVALNIENMRRPSPTITPEHLGAWTSTTKAKPLPGEPQTLTYPAGLSKLGTAPPTYRLDTWTRKIGHGQDTFKRTQDAVTTWVGHTQGAGFTLLPSHPRLEAGTNLTVVIPFGPVAFTAPTQIVDVIDEPAAAGFTYGTLPGHFSQGEESFTATIGDGGGVHVTITAVWRPAWWLLRLGGPITRLIQRQAIQRWLDGIERHAA